MKLRAFPVLALLCSALSLASAAPVALYTWDFGQALTNDSTVEVPESAGGPALQFRFPTLLQADPDEQNKLVLVFDGNQTDSGRTKGNLDPLDKIQLLLRFKPTTRGAALQTIVSASGCYELRYNLGRSRLEFIVLNLPEKKYLSIHVPVTADIWNQAEATYVDGKLTLSVGLSRSEGALPEGVRPTAVSTTVRIGQVNARPYTGAISSLAIAIP